jgi:CHASE3 domain sensor protein
VVEVALTLYEKVSLNFGSGVVAVALIGTLSYVSLGKLAAATRAAGDTEAVLEQVDMLRASVADASTAQRDYLLHGNSDDRDRFQHARRAAEHDVSRLRTSVGSGGATPQRVDSLAPLLTAHLNDLERIANVRSRSGLDSAALSMRQAGVVDTRRRLEALLSEIRDDQRLLFGSR